MAPRTVPAPATLAGLDPALRTAVRGFETIAINSAKEVRDIIPYLYKKKVFEPKKITMPVYAGIGGGGEWDGKSVITPNDLTFLYDVTAENLIYANAAEHSFEAENFDLYKLQGKRKWKELGKNAAHVQQMAALNPFNLGFTVNWADGVPFFSDNHPLLGGGTQSNLVHGPLSYDTVMDGYIKGISMVDPLGREVTQDLTAIYVARHNVPYAKSILNIGMKEAAGSANHDRNPFADENVHVIPLAWPLTHNGFIMQFSESEAYHSGKMPITFRKPRETDAEGIKQSVVWIDAFWFEGYTGFVASSGL